MGPRYDVRAEDGAWTVLDLITRRPAMLKGAPQQRLWYWQATDVASLLNYLEDRKAQAGLRASRALRKPLGQAG